MPKVNTIYNRKRQFSPLSFWVHKPLDADTLDRASVFEPPMPGPVPGKGYPVYEIEYRGHTLFFCSTSEIRHCINILSEKVLPTTQSLAMKAGYPGYQHLHWLATWPGDIKSWKDRNELIKSLKQYLDMTEQKISRPTT
jgi:hypothetical protein